MIRSESEYQEALRQFGEQAQRLREQERELRKLGLSRDEIKRAMDPVRSFHAQLNEEVASYERLKRGEFDELRNLHGIGQLLIALRIFRGLTQRELAQRLGIHESQVSRDERNEYHGITLERAGRILEALGAELRSTVESIEREAVAV